MFCQTSEQNIVKTNLAAETKVYCTTMNFTLALLVPEAVH